MRRLLIFGGLLFVGGAGAAFMLAQAPTRAASEVNWRTVSVERGAIIATVSATGTINPTATAIIGSQVSGQVVEIVKDFNAVVKAGDLLARLNSEQIRARLDAARADLLQAQALNRINRAQVEKVRADIDRAGATRADAEANRARATALLDDAEKTYQRQQELRQRGIASEVAMQAASTQRETSRAALAQADAQIRSVSAQLAALAADLKVAEAQVASSDAQVVQREAIVRQIEVDLKNTEIRSSVDGVVIQRNIELGQTVAASLQAPTLFLVAQDLSEIEIYANVDEADVGRVQAGQDVTFTVTAYPGREFAGRVKTVRLGSQTVQNVVIYTAVIAVRNEGLALKPGMTATIRIFTERRENVLRVSNSALRWRPPGELPAATVGETQRASAGDSNPFEAPAGGGRGQGRSAGEGQGPGGQVLERLAADLQLTPEQRRQAEEIGRELRQQLMAQASAETPEARRERARQFRQQFIERLRPLLTEVQVAKLAELRPAVAGRGAREGAPGRIHVVGPDGRAVAVAIRTGATDGTYTEIVSGGVEAGARAIIGGGARASAAAQRPPARIGF